MCGGVCVLWGIVFAYWLVSFVTVSMITTAWLLLVAGREAFLQEKGGGAGEAEAYGGQARACRHARHHRRARTDDDVPQSKP